MLNKNGTFHKSERLTSEVQISELFAKGKSFVEFPYRVVFLAHPAEPSLSVLVSAPKKRFKHAVDRNRIKRLTREAYRRNKFAICEALEERGLGLRLALAYVGNEMISYAETERKMKKLTEKLLTKL